MPGILATDRDFGDLSPYVFSTERDADYALAACRLASANNFPFWRQGGLTWFLSGFLYTGYCHAQEPNGSIPDGLNRSFTPSGISTARSQHPGGVNALMADGSVRFVSETIARKVWRGLGTRYGDELVE
jgi:prepilin-type processing-associated H-X9-DG protein